MKHSKKTTELELELESARRDYYDLHRLLTIIEDIHPHAYREAQTIYSRMEREDTEELGQ